MDGFARPAGPAGVRPQPAPVGAQRPVAAAPRPAPRVAPAQAYSQPPARPAAAAAPQSTSRRQQPVQQQVAAVPRKGGGWKVVLQFALGLLVIAAVAGTIVYLYVKYYAQ